MSLEFIPLTSENSAIGFELHNLGQPNPWSRKIFDDCLSQPYFAFYLGSTSQYLGYFIAMQVVDELTIMDIGVRKVERGRGYGRLLINYIVDYCEKNNIQQVWLEVRQSNTAAINLYESVGFNVIETRHDYYVGANGKEDALIMCLQVCFN
ncbi:ribosomal protein S18-alanine N-acetyltransferase [Paraglaciecola aquimarina]|uniref:[Ribosomal protein bS18]-alanine N-acetyltransferase n=1 Tax=Paraglaciecola algarum TaxID=3050085 RepID=A0ABS9D512_9ALTE|nr:ribosomal protein S18-alanine N-acetyltransferase [Paraglaciecola sp. G1-23]MCF2946899.1 ribosomal protein S18-alanine N-acetyltransferase [Paraglaciecola sp. G1-23]